MRILILSILFSTYVSCSGSVQELSFKKIVQNKVFEGKQIYKAENDTILQVLGVKKLSDNMIDYVLFVFNKNKNISSQIEGKAKKKGGDMEFDEDESGNSIPVDEFISDNTCWMDIRISHEDGATASIISAKCHKEKEEQELPYNSIKLLKKVK